MAQRVSSPVFVGRTNELAELIAAMTRAAEGAPGLVLVGGEAGVGKSRLISELATRAVHGGLRVAVGQCVGLDEATIPLLPVADALRGLAEAGAPDLPSAAVAPAGGALAEGPSSRLHVLVLDRLADAAAAGPVVLVIEDVHWADRSTLELLRFLARRLRDERILVVATYRDDEVDRREDLRRFLADVATAAAVRRLALERLTRADMGEQLAGILGAAPPPELLEAVFARSECTTGCWRRRRGCPSRSGPPRCGRPCASCGRSSPIPSGRWAPTAPPCWSWRRTRPRPRAAPPRP
ncbi:MAG TPA: ATP-binding protein [Solirubrobacteraceae bacterium]|nr:ATP-binding protein [Solirubrobacteraceae bacterium]